MMHIRQMTPLKLQETGVMLKTPAQNRMQKEAAGKISSKSNIKASPGGTEG